MIRVQHRAVLAVSQYLWQIRRKRMVVRVAPDLVRDAFSGEIAVGRNIIMTAKGLPCFRSQQRGKLLRREEIIFALLALAVRVLRAVEATLG